MARESCIVAGLGATALLVAVVSLLVVLVCVIIVAARQGRVTLEGCAGKISVRV